MAFLQPIGRKHHLTEFDERSYYSYWMTCVGRCLASQDLSFLDDPGYYSVLQADDLPQATRPTASSLGNLEDRRSPNKKKRGNAQLAKMTDVIRLDLYCEAQELDRPYSAVGSLVLGQDYKHVDTDAEVFLLYREYSMAAKRLSSQADLDFKSTCYKISEELNLLTD